MVVLLYANKHSHPRILVMHSITLYGRLLIFQKDKLTQGSSNRKFHSLHIET